jgi:hypothetical protein
MKTTMKTMLVLVALSASALILNAQDAGGPLPGGQRPYRDQGGPGRPGGPGGPGGPGMRRMPPSPLMEALDANHDGVIDAAEIANASAALKSLDKNGDGQLTPDELRPQRPQGPQGEGRPPRQDGPAPQHPPQDN